MKLTATLFVAVAFVATVAAFSDPNEDKPARDNLPKDAKVSAEFGHRWMPPA